MTTYADIIKKSVIEGFVYADFSTTKILITLLITYVIAMYIHLIYKFVTKNAFYLKSYGVSMTIISVITAGIVLAMQSSLVISLGMVGALSIVRFRTAIKDPMDLLFLFWSIGTGIVCGAGLYGLAIIVAIVATVGILVFEIIPVKRNMFLLVLNANSADCEEDVYRIISEECAGYKVRSKCVDRKGIDIIVEVKLKEKNSQIVNMLLKIENVESVTLLENEVNVKA